jgi:hypothetical protein
MPVNSYPATCSIGTTARGSIGNVFIGGIVLGGSGCRSSHHRQETRRGVRQRGVRPPHRLAYYCLETYAPRMRRVKEKKRRGIPALFSVSSGFCTAIAPPHGGHAEQLTP